MKKLSIFAITLTIAFSIQAQQKNSQYAIKTGHVIFELTGNTVGTKEIWWSNYGEIQRTDIKATTTTKFFGSVTEKKTHTVNIIKKDKFWSVDYIEKTGQKGISPVYQESVEIVENMTEAELKKLGDDLIASIGGERLGTETFLGRNCELITALGFKSWIYMGVVLKTEGNLLGFKTSEAATKFEENPTINSATFNPPSDVQYVELSF